MNGRKARALRRAASRMTAGMPARQLRTEQGYLVPVHTGKLDAMGKPIMRQAPVTGTSRHSPTSTRAVYQKLKKVYGHTDLGALK
ncbi:hypothetical protein [Achromobacter pestifer]|uniref:Uncharacterized protein n=1 Tax=Achromobacter pestifer TaxID=1353889 RepID=A0A6S6YNR4_9BURK|nr:hypothetical protein [Achromobacter pestifer]CAB3624568.1 hypothetical protein LMG3431_00035 [Achromobacter pestifer]